ncbi:hypothetical protein [Curtobacterium sp. 9128]|uniref:hypothetical protein n=1 Tax=Curtobacterium sp. 9128 TaxID=1793722 RepID=UPI0011A457D5|nr:hypothetical protein [Curtobacterium sp. 9128]
MGIARAGAVVGVGLLGVVLLALALRSCAFGATACPAVGWTNTIEVRVPGSDAATSPVHRVVVCLERGCTPGVASADAAMPSGDATPAAPGPGTVQEPTPTPTLAVEPFSTAVHDGDRWTIPTTMGTPEHGRVALRDDTGTTLRERAVDLDWVRHGGSAQCGGPSTASVMIPFES